MIFDHEIPGKSGSLWPSLQVSAAALWLPSGSPTKRTQGF